MAARSNAITELVRFWLEARHQCLAHESLPVPVYRGISDIDLLAVRGNMTQFPLPDRTEVGPRVIVETKDEHDYDWKGKGFARGFAADISRLGDNLFIPETRPSTPCYFTMLREQHFRRATEFFGGESFDRLFVFHAIDRTVMDVTKEHMEAKGIYVLSVGEVVSDLCNWYSTYQGKPRLRHTLTGDMWHLLVGFCGCAPADR